MVERHGFPQVEFGTADEFLEAANSPDLWHPRKALPHIIRTLIVPHTRTHYDLVVDAFKPGDTVVTSCLGVGARIAHDKVDIPLVTLHLQPAVMWSEHAPPRLPGMFGPDWLRRLQFRVAEVIVDRMMAPPINELRRELDLPPVKNILHWWHSPRGSLCLFPDWFAAPQPDWPPAVLADFPLWDDRADESMDRDVLEFLDAGQPPLVFTPGSANRFGHRFFQESVAATQRLGGRAILLSRFGEQFPPGLPDFVLAKDYVPLKTLLPRCAALAHHGGVGTTAQAMLAGIPQLIMALAHDQYDNGARIERLGIGSWLPSRKYSARRVARMLAWALGEEVVQRAAERARSMRTDGLELAARALERQGQPFGVR